MMWPYEKTLGSLVACRRHSTVSITWIAVAGTMSVVTTLVLPLRTTPVADSDETAAPFTLWLHWASQHGGHYVTVTLIGRMDWLLGFSGSNRFSTIPAGAWRFVCPERTPCGARTGVSRPNRPPQRQQRVVNVPAVSHHLLIR